MANWWEPPQGQGYLPNATPVWYDPARDRWFSFVNGQAHELPPSMQSMDALNALGAAGRIFQVDVNVAQGAPPAAAPAPPAPAPTVMGSVAPERPRAPTPRVTGGSQSVPDLAGRGMAPTGAAEQQARWYAQTGSYARPASESPPALPALPAGPTRDELLAHAPAGSFQRSMLEAQLAGQLVNPMGEPNQGQPYTTTMTSTPAAAPQPVPVPPPLPILPEPPERRLGPEQPFARGGMVRYAGGGMSAMPGMEMGMGGMGGMEGMGMDMASPPALPPMPSAPNAIVGEGRDTDGTPAGEVVILPTATGVYYTEGETHAALPPGTKIVPLRHDLDGEVGAGLPPLPPDLGMKADMGGMKHGAAMAQKGKKTATAKGKDAPPPMPGKGAGAEYPPAFAGGGVYGPYGPGADQPEGSVLRSQGHVYPPGVLFPPSPEYPGGPGNLREWRSLTPRLRNETEALADRYRLMGPGSSRLAPYG